MGGRIVSQVVNYGDRPGARAPDRPGQDADRSLPRGRDRRSAPLQQPLREHHEAGAGARHDHPHPDGPGRRPRARSSSRRRRAPTAGTTSTSPTRKSVLDELLVRYIETFVYQAAADNIASEQSARMVAMKAASDNARQHHRRAAAHLQQEPAGRYHQGTLGNRRRRRGRLTPRRIQLQDSGSRYDHVTSSRHHRPVHRRRHRHRVPARIDAAGLRRAHARGHRQQARREGAHVRSRAAARRRRRAHDRARLVGRPAARHEGAAAPVRQSRCRSAPACSDA